MKELISVVLGGIIIYLFKLYFDKDRIKKIKVNIRNYIFEGKRVTLEKSIDAFALKNSEMYEDWFRAYFSFDLSLPFNSYVNSFEINFVLDGYKLNKGSFQSVGLCYKDRGGVPFSGYHHQNGSTCTFYISAKDSYKFKSGRYVLSICWVSKDYIIRRRNEIDII